MRDRYAPHMADAAAPPRGPGRSPAHTPRRAGPVLVAALIVFALVTVALIALLRTVGDEAPTAHLAPHAQLLAPADIALELPQERERVAPPPEDVAIEPLADAPDPTPDLRRVTSIMSWWDRPFEGANERAPCTLIVVD